MKNIQILIGSNAKNSLNKSLALDIINKYGSLANFELLYINDLPFYNYEEENPLPSTVSKFLNKIKNTDGIIITTPEYNNSIPGILKNALDWASRGEKVFNNKAVMLMGITPSLLGTVRAQDHIRLILSHSVYNARILGGEQILIGQSFLKLNENKELIDKKTLDLIEKKLKEFLDFM